MSGRKLRPEEMHLWNKVTDQVAPIQRDVMPEALQSKTTPTVDVQSPQSFLSMPEISGGKTPMKNSLVPPVSQQLATNHVAMDRKAFKKLQRGRLKPDARIDLHGMTLDRAHGALTRFILTSHSSGKRLCLVITGKGKNRDNGGPIPVRFGVLKHQVPEWLRLPPLSSAVLQVTQAHISHGGEGAYYVYLKRAR